MTTVIVTHRDWFRTIDEDQSDPSVGCYQTGGELSKAVLEDGIHADGITKEALNSCFDTDLLPYEKVERVARGYLFWRFGDGRRVRVITRDSDDPTPASASDPDHQKLFGSLHDKQLRLVLSLIDSRNQYWDQLLKVELSFFKRIWGAILPAKTIATKIKATVCQHPVKYGIDKLLIVLQSTGIRGIDSDQNIIRKFAREIPVKEVQQIWERMQQLLSADKQSLSYVFLKEVELRAQDLTEKPEQKIRTGEPFRNWLFKRKTLSLFLKQAGIVVPSEMESLAKQMMTRLVISQKRD